LINPTSASHHRNPIPVKPKDPAEHKEILDNYMAQSIKKNKYLQELWDRCEAEGDHIHAKYFAFLKHETEEI